MNRIVTITLCTLIALACVTNANAGYVQTSIDYTVIPAQTPAGENYYYESPMTVTVGAGSFNDEVNAAIRATVPNTDFMKALMSDEPVLKKTKAADPKAKGEIQAYTMDHNGRIDKTKIAALQNTKKVALKTLKTQLKTTSSIDEVNEPQYEIDPDEWVNVWESDRFNIYSPGDEYVVENRLFPPTVNIKGEEFVIGGAPYLSVENMDLPEDDDFRYLNRQMFWAERISDPYNSFGTISSYYDSVKANPQILSNMEADIWYVIVSNWACFEWYNIDDFNNGIQAFVDKGMGKGFSHYFETGEDFDKWDQSTGLCMPDTVLGYVYAGRANPYELTTFDVNLKDPVDGTPFKVRNRQTGLPTGKTLADGGDYYAVTFYKVVDGLRTLPHGQQEGYVSQATLKVPKATGHSTVGIDKATTEEKAKAYRTADGVTIELPEWRPGAKATIYDMNGRMLASEALNDAVNKINANLPKNSMYIIKVDTDKGAQSIKLR
ncbi:hypothetical protein AAIR98_001244 [Elusimicrobium simillimum]|uniref:T9SS type A sorting domain-containing protein n=1 Tax=Elusimicrobium simillimum TaxID=3143438 RepID=UPI003C6F20F9